VDKDGDYSSLALDSNGNPHITYLANDVVNLVLRYASWSGSAWIIQTITNNAIEGSLALDSNDNPHISYNDKYASWNSSDWTVQTIDQGGFHNSLALDSSDNPHICYCYNLGGAGVLNYVSWNGSTWNIQTVDKNVDIYNKCSLALDSAGNPHITYYDNAQSFLKYASWTDSQWIVQTVDQTSSGFSSLALDSSGNQHISYYYGIKGGFLNYASWNGSKWNIQTVDYNKPFVTEKYPLTYTSLALDLAGNPHISYGGGGYLRYASLGTSNSTDYSISYAIIIGMVVVVFIMAVLLLFRKRQIKKSKIDAPNHFIVILGVIK
jgi:hypothetical protein